MTMRVMFCAALLAVASLAQAQSGEPAAPVETAAPAAPAAPATAAVADPNEKICKVGRELGSNKLKRVCRTRAQIEADREAAREALTREQQR